MPKLALLMENYNFDIIPQGATVISSRKKRIALFASLEKSASHPLPISKTLQILRQNQQKRVAATLFRSRFFDSSGGLGAQQAVYNFVGAWAALGGPNRGLDRPAQFAPIFEGSLSRWIPMISGRMWRLDAGHWMACKTSVCSAEPC